MPELPLLYTDLASWWPVLSAPEDYETEADCFRQMIQQHARLPDRAVPRTLLELGSGGGNNASFIKKHFTMTLVDLSEGMLAVSMELNPECEHLLGDMRSVRLQRTFDSVFIHDAIGYMLTEKDLVSAMQTAAIHCRPGGVVLIAPDWTKENFVSDTDHGGHEVGDRSMRYLQWQYDPDPNDTTYLLDMVYLLREGDTPTRVVHDVHELGLFSRQTWLDLLTQAGLQPKLLPDPHYGRDLFIGLR
jgi:trans-aconitate methyltransferase